MNALKHGERCADRIAARQECRHLLKMLRAAELEVVQDSSLAGSRALWIGRIAEEWESANQARQ
jgi:hypothetical protein